jgi:hypothetical protein
VTSEGKLSKDYQFKKLRTSANYDNIEFLSLSYDEKMQPMLSEATIKKKLENITKILNYKECFIVKYEVIARNSKNS